MAQIHLALPEERVVLFAHLASQLLGLRNVLTVVTVQGMQFFRLLKSK